mmetsp:Transcript_17619/g.27259  ORF Transcript_17619/g.27259 Transcript_17619/m.27259 type:complete len:140 (+) Transcript_17619:3240-3659(+)
MFPESGFGNNTVLQNNNQNRLVSLSTANIKNFKKAQQMKENTMEQVRISKYDIEQYNNVKSILINFSFENAGQKTLCVEIIENVMDELRRERKILMVLADSNIEQYIKLDLGEVEKEEEMSPFKKQVIAEKKKFREELT